MNLFDKAVLFVASGCYAGYLPAAPGTWGSAVGVIICYGLSVLPYPAAGIWLGLGVVFSMWVAGRAESILQQKDSGCIVIDEIMGMAVTLAGLPFTPATVVLGFVLFRILDITKPFPIRWLDSKLSGGLGIVADDIAAGIAGNLVLRVFF